MILGYRAAMKLQQIRHTAEVNQGRKRWMQRTPAMAEGLVDHIWTIKELMTFRAPCQ